MQQTWRWFGPGDKVSLTDVRQAGATGIVTALHDLPNGAVWSKSDIQARQQIIGRSSDGKETGLNWSVVESLPVSEDIKRQSGEWRAHLDSYKTSLRNLGACGIRTVCYNFMPVLDWTRTDVRFTLPNGARCMRFDAIDFAAFDIFILKRPGAREDFPDDIVDAAQHRVRQFSDADKQRLVDNIICGLPGAEEGYTLDALRARLKDYAGIDQAKLRAHQIDFLSEVIPAAEEAGVNLCCHPDDPPFGLLGLPRIMSTEEDYSRLVEAVTSKANGITLCSGSMGVRVQNDLPGMVDRLGPHIHFIHLRNVHRETETLPNSFYEAAHLEGATDMVALIAAILREEARRRVEGREDASIPFRPDHGQDILTDLETDTQPGYPAIGRLKGLAELRGIIAALSGSQMAAA